MTELYIVTENKGNERYKGVITGASRGVRGIAGYSKDIVSIGWIYEPYPLTWYWDRVSKASVKKLVRYRG